MHESSHMRVFFSMGKCWHLCDIRLFHVNECLMLLQDVNSEKKNRHLSWVCWLCVCGLRTVFACNTRLTWQLIRIGYKISHQILIYYYYFCVCVCNERKLPFFRHSKHLWYVIRYKISISISLVLLGFSFLPLPICFTHQMSLEAIRGPKEHKLGIFIPSHGKSPKKKNTEIQHLLDVGGRKNFPNFIRITNLIELCYSFLLVFTPWINMWHFSDHPNLHQTHVNEELII